MTWNPATKTPKIILSNSDRNVEMTTGSGTGSVISLDGFSSGKRYFEFDFITRTNSTQWIGFCTANHSAFDYPGMNAESWGLQLINTASGAGLCRAYHNGAYVEYADRLPGNEGGTVRVAIDMDNQKAWYSTDTIAWPAPPTNPASGFAHDFSGATGPFYIVFYGGRDIAYSTSGQGNFTTAQMSYAIPSGFVGFADGGAQPSYLDLGTGTLTLTGQPHDQTGGVFPVYLDIWPGVLSFAGQPITVEGAQPAADVYLEHARAGPYLILNGRRADGAYYSPPLRAARSQPAQSALLWHLVTGGKWYIEYKPVVGNTITYAYDNLRVGLARGDAPLDTMLGDGDQHMFTFGGWNEQAYLMRFGNRLSAARSNSQGLGALEPKGIAFDLTDARNGKLWYHNGGQWGQGDPVAGTTPDYSGLAGAWFVAVSARAGFEMTFEPAPAFAPAGYTNLFGSAAAPITRLWGHAEIRLDSVATITQTATDLLLAIGNHLLRSATWHKRGSYYLALLTGVSPVVEVAAPGYARQWVQTGDAQWMASYQSVNTYTFPLFDGTVVGWALYAAESGGSPVYVHALTPPFVATASGPAFSVPANQWTWDVT